MNTISTRQLFSAQIPKVGSRSQQAAPVLSKNGSTHAPSTRGRGIAIKDTVEINLSQLKLKKFDDLPVPRLTPQASPREYKAQLDKQGDVRQTGIIKQNGKILGTISNKGITTFSNSIGSAIHDAGRGTHGSVDSIQSLLSRRYGGSVTVEKFAPGTGPTYAEVHGNVYKESYKSLVERQTQEYQSEYRGNTLYRRVDVTA